jgi:hypothetical protein
MCTGSLHTPHRNASKVEELKVRAIPNTGFYGLYPRSGKDQRLVCLRGRTEIVVKQIMLRPGAVSSKTLRLLQGKRNVKATFVFNGYGDTIEFGKQKVLIHCCQIGMQIDVGVPVAKRQRKITGKPGMKVIERALREIAVLPRDARGRFVAHLTPIRRMFFIQAQRKA